MGRNECGRSRCTAGASGGTLALMMLVVLAVASSVSASAKDKNQALTQVYQHTYDEVFQASQEAIERMGLFVTGHDKDKGTISGNGAYRMQCVAGPCEMKVAFDIRLETVSAKPETRVTIDATRHGITGHGEGITQFKNALLSEVQRVLSTYH